MMTLNTELEAARLYEDMFGKKYFSGGVAYKVQADDGSATVSTIMHGKDGGEVFRKAQCLITSDKGIFFDIIIADTAQFTPISITPSQYIKPSDLE
ncbi:hypothetical protein Q8P09_12220 [Psychrobacter faecalis]|uniref:Uncharacterized protein n=1 Tax=Psychrobacter faecalis TaxID=180588 RepID=A0ABT9HJ87_9GAMM|nr:hypothetical protein [Psychrobacter faecalis]MDP4545840.1 hypothetical protein [Psychrobacter faecalis]